MGQECSSDGGGMAVEAVASGSCFGDTHDVVVRGEVLGEYVAELSRHLGCKCGSMRCVSSKPGEGVMREFLPVVCLFCRALDRLSFLISLE